MRKRGADGKVKPEVEEKPRQMKQYLDWEAKYREYRLEFHSGFVHVCVWVMCVCVCFSQ